MSQQGRLKDLESSLETLTGNTGGPIAPDSAGNINTLGTGSIIINGNPGTFTLTTELTGLTEFSVLVGADTPTITKVAPGVTGIPLVSQGAAANPAFSTAVVGGGGTGATSFTPGSVIFMGATTFAQDNANFFWDDLNNRLGLGTDIPLTTLDLIGNSTFTYTAIEDDDQAILINCDSVGFADFKCIDIVYNPGVITGGQNEEAILINIDESTSTGGSIFGVEVLSTDIGLADIYAAKSGLNVNPIIQNSGTFGNADSILNIAVDVLAALSSGGAGNISVFVADDDTITIGRSIKFAEIEFMLDTVASGAGIAPTFEFSTGVGTFTTFAPADGTNGMRNNGILDWDVSSIPTWVVGTGAEFLIRITRTRNVLGTTPILDLVQVGGVTVFSWDRDGDVSINSLTLVVPLTVPNGGTGNSSLTDGGILLGSGTDPITVTAQPTDGQVLIGSTGVDPVLSTITPGVGISILNGAGSITINTEGGGIDWSVITVNQTAVVNEGYICNKGTALELLLPATAVVGNIIRVTGINTALGIKITQNAGQQIHFGTSSTTVGITGFVQSIAIRDSLEMVAVVAGGSTIWNVISSTGNFTIN